MLIEPETQAGNQDAVGAWNEQQEKAWGYLPNYAGLFASRPDVAEAWTHLNLTVRGGMDRRRFELATIAAARARSSTYCLAAHSKFLRDICRDEPAMLAMAADPTGSTLGPVDEAVIGFAAKAAVAPASIDDEDVARLHEQGLSDADVADVVFAVAARCFFATVLDAGGAEPDPQLGDIFEPDIRARLVVGRPFAAE
ncbi:MAG: carboxymuconolactone decarboxylase family protein [Nocardioidaceae bacterium]